VSSLPEGWAETALGAIGHYWNGRAFKKSEWRPFGQGRPILRIQDLTGSNDKPNYFDGEADDRNVARPGDLLVSWAATLGVYEWSGSEAVINQHIFKVESFIDRRFHRYLIEHVLDDLRRRAHGTGMVHVTRKVFDETSVLLPPSREQERIVAAIEEHFSRIEAAEAALGSSRSRLGVFTEAVHRSLMSGEPVSLGELLAEPLVNGRSVPTADVGFPVLRLSALKDGLIDVTERKVGAWTKNDAERFLVKTDDFFISRGNGSLALVGRGGLVEAEGEEVAFPDTMIRARVDSTRIDRRFLRLVWNSALTRRQIETTARTTAGIYKVNQQDLSSVVLPVPPIDVQREVVAQMEQQLSLADALRTAIDHAVVRSGHVRRSILSEAFSGRLVPQDPTDEPAPELLARFAAQRSDALSSRGRPRA
jgi:type I restriction enzyme S subunit